MTYKSGINEHKVFAVIFAGGTGSRMSGAKIPKQFLKQGGQTIIAHTLAHFQNCKSVDAITVVCVQDWIPFLQEEIRNHGFDKVDTIVPGGETGQDSIFNGLEAIAKNLSPRPEDVVLVHDGVRPLINQLVIAACIDSVVSNGPTATVSSSTETVIKEKDGQVLDVLDRSICKFARAPQGFLFGDLYDVHLKARKENKHNFIDSISLMNYYGFKTFTIDGPDENIKITTPRDFFTFKAYMDMQEIRQIWE